MSRTTPSLMFRLPALVAATWLAACTRPEPAPTAPAPAAPSGEAPAPTLPPPASDETPPPPADAPAGPAQPSPNAPAPDESSPVPQPAATEDGPPLESMRLASTNAKIGVPVDLRYTFEGGVLHLAAIPRVAGSNLRISVQHAPGLEFSEGSLNVQKATQAGIYRKQLAVTLLPSAPPQIRVLVTMGVDGGSGHAFYSIPLDSVKQH
jgi:hypothetical protein